MCSAKSQKYGILEEKCAQNKGFYCIKRYSAVNRGERKRKAKRIAAERIDILYRLAEERAMNGDFDLAARYVELILKLSRKHNIRLSREKKYHVCKKCNSFLIPGKNATVRLKKGKVVIKCHMCGSYKRYPYR